MDQNVLNDHNYYSCNFDENEYEIKCAFCLEKYDKAADLLAHIQYKHFKIKPEMYNSNKKLTLDVVDKEASECALCFIKFDKTDDILAHIKQNHLNIKPELYNNNNDNNCLSTFTNANDIAKVINPAHDHDCYTKHPKKKTNLTKNHSYRKCFVPNCGNTSKKYPSKIFLWVPKNLERRKSWFKAVNRQFGSNYSGKYFCCEDHFDLENDTKNWLKYKMLGPRPLLIKEGVLPRIVNKAVENGSEFQATMQQTLQENITSKEIDVETVNLCQNSTNSAISVNDKEIDESDDSDWCIDDEESSNQQKQTIQVDNDDSNETKVLKNDVESAKEENNLDNKIYTANQEGDNNDQPKEMKEDSDLSLQTDENDSLEPIVEMLHCDDCPSSFSNQEDMLQHTRVWHGTTNRRKLSSTETNDSLYKLQNLVIVETKDLNLMIDSDVFEKFDNFQRETVQINIDHSDTPESNKLTTKKRQFCTICKRDYAYNNFKEHLQQVHSETKIFCSICGAQFKCERYMRRHILHIHQNQPRPIQRRYKCKCPECPKAFKNSDCLSHHIKNCHGDKVECELCHSKLKSISYLKTHMRRVHYNDGKKHRCRVCRKPFKSPRQVKIHMINLHPETLHPCPRCVRLFLNTVQLKIHLNRCRATKEDVVSAKEDSEIVDEESESSIIVE